MRAGPARAHAPALPTAPAATLLALAVALAGAAAPRPAAALANPASTHCVAQGGSLVLERDGAGGSFGVCRFEGNRQCEEWALLRGDCPAGGVDVSGYATPAARYCALRGGRYAVLSGAGSAAEQGSCSFGAERSCAAAAFFAGLCRAATAASVYHARYACSGEQWVDAVYSSGEPSTVSLLLSDGRRLVLLQAISASGARYTTPDERFEFWNKGRTAFIYEQGRQTYRDCAEPR